MQYDSHLNHDAMCLAHKLKVLKITYEQEKAIYIMTNKKSSTWKKDAK